jgi:hypothetical protein
LIAGLTHTNNLAKQGSMKPERSYEINTLLCLVKKISDKPAPKF